MHLIFQQRLQLERESQIGLEGDNQVIEAVILRWSHRVQILPRIQRQNDGLVVLLGDDGASCGFLCRV